MHRISTHALAFAGALLVSLAGFAPQAAAQPTASSARPSWSLFRPTAPATPLADVPETAGSRRRPTRRSGPRSVRPDTLVAVSSRFAPSRSASTSMSSERIAMVSSTLRAAGRPWIGTPYRWGGDSRRGIDCSAFVRQYMRDNLGVELPRATLGQQYEGVSIDRHDLLPGDLVFFRRRSVRHVGVYLGEGEFIHASSSRGVTVSSLSEAYWESAYWMSRRVLSAPSGRRPTPRREAGVRG